MKKTQIKKQAEEFFESEKIAHISVSRDNHFKYFYNGRIVELEKDFLVIDDFKLGLNPIFLKEVFSIKEFEPKPIDKVIKNIKEFQEKNFVIPDDFDEEVKE